MESLTGRQQSVLDVIREHIREEGYPPTVREIGAKLNLRSSCTVQKHLEALIRKGYLRRDGSKSRTIEIVGESPQSRRRAGVVDVPLVGRVAAGVPILAEEHIEDHVPLPMDWVRTDEVFILKVRGDSMIEAGVLDGDLVVVRQQTTAENGDMVVAMTPDGEATVKYFFRDNGRFRLQPANSEMEPIYVDEVEVLGKAVMTIRKL